MLVMMLLLMLMLLMLLTLNRRRREDEEKDGECTKKPEPQSRDMGNYRNLGGTFKEGRGGIPLKSHADRNP